MKRELLLQNPRPDGYHLMLEFFGCDTGKLTLFPFFVKQSRPPFKQPD